MHSEKEVAKFAFASVCSIKPIKKGEKFSKYNIWVKKDLELEITLLFLISHY